MADSYTLNISSTDALWALIQSQTKSVREALYRRMIESENDKKTLRQQEYVRKSLKKALDELKEAKASNQNLPDARSLFKLMDE